MSPVDLWGLGLAIGLVVALVAALLLLWIRALAGQIIAQAEQAVAQAEAIARHTAPLWDLRLLNARLGRVAGHLAALPPSLAAQDGGQHA
jgi:hypothetical protein|uniref:Uncharacterized protein n=1 Tax=Thermorudis sp. TaxID=1969470 RepID=A0A7C2WRH7_9BACT